MDSFKITLFEKDQTGSFPKFASLSEAECRELVRSISERFEIDTANFEKELTQKQSYYDGSNAEDRFGLIDTLNSLKIRPLSKIFINWSRWSELNMDVFDIKDLDKYFGDIWFPSSDDIDLFDESLTWIVSIRHDGCVSYKLLTQ
jgi:hypothetical protein